MALGPQPKIPISFTQHDTEDLAQAIRQLRRLRYPFDTAERDQAIRELEAFAGEFAVPFMDFRHPEDYIESNKLFGRLKGRILFAMRKELTKKSQRDAESLQKIFTVFTGFDERLPE